MTEAKIGTPEYSEQMLQAKIAAVIADRDRALDQLAAAQQEIARLTGRLSCGSSSGTERKKPTGKPQG